MDPMILMSLLGTLGEVATTAIGDALAAGDKQKAMQIYEAAYEKAQGLKPPKQETMNAIEQAASSLTSYQEDPRLKGVQMKALEGLEREVAMQGMTPETAEEYNRARLQAGEIASGLEGAAAQRASQRGLGGMAAYAGALGGSQAAANRAGQMGLQSAADARRRYLQALEGLGTMGSQVRGQEFGFASQRAQAQDAINRFNALQRSEAQKYNLEAGQRGFENELAILRAQQGAGGQYADALKGRAADTQQTAGRYGKAGKELLTGIGYAGGLGKP